MIRRLLIRRTFTGWAALPLLVFVASVGAGGVEGQDPSPPYLVEPLTGDAAPLGPAGFEAPRLFADAPWQPPIVSALLPGAGQLAMGQRRGWVYAALEIVGWVAYADRRGQGREFRTRYRDFAWEEARTQSGARVESDFRYYETLTKWTTSGLFDSDGARAGIQPETDASTFNGSIWALASGIFLPPGESVPTDDPRYLRAIEYYQDRAFGTELLWDWSGTGSAQDDYADLIRTSDDGFRQATNVLGAVIANHVVSAIDAFVSARGLATPEASRIDVMATPTGARWSFTTSWAVPR